MGGHILIVDDDVLLRRSLAFNLEKAGYRASTAATAEDALGMSRHDRPDLVLLDISLPGMDGLEALRHFQNEVGTPVIFLTARRRELDEILGLELGADDYITKPFSTDLLLARIKAVLRRAAHPSTPSSENGPLQVGDLRIDPTAHTVTLAGQPVELAPRTFDLLHVLALNAGRVLAAEKLLSLVWGAEYEGEPQVLYVHIRWLREKLEENPSDPRRIVTVRGVGYKLITVEED
jgi:DNA-binding response OmpR family regulator